MRGFFAGSVTAQSLAPAALVPRCGRCGLFKGCQSPKMPPTGTGRRRVLIVGEAPGKTEDEQNRQFVGKAGETLRKHLTRVGVDLDADCWVTNTLICRPPGNATPTAEQIEDCAPNLVSAIKRHAPDIIIPLGAVAVRAVIGPIWQEDPGSMERWAGWRVPAQKWNAWICPTYHPSYVMRLEEDGKRKNNTSESEVVDLWYNRHLTAAFALEGKPWDVVPDYKKEVRVILDHNKAAKYIDRYVAANRPCAFDFETTCLKPDGPGAEIVCCSISDGKHTISFPWHGAVIPAMQRFCASPVPKIASNAKFEDRWARVAFGQRVRNWWWDTMIAAHICDNRPGISSIKFQSFIRFGFPAYNKHIEPFLRSKGSREVNQILQQVDMHDLMLYCGLDSLLEFKVCLDQRKELQYENQDIHQPR